MSLLVVVLAAAVAAAAAASPASLTVLSGAELFQDGAARTLAARELPVVIATALGRAHQEMAFSGLAASNPFSPPASATTVVVPGLRDAFSAVPAKHVYSLTGSVETPIVATHLAALASTTTSQCLVSAAADPFTALAAGATGSVVHRATHADRFVAPSATSTASLPEGLSYDATTGTYRVALSASNTVAIPARAAHTEALFAEVAALASVVDTLPESCNPKIATLVLSTVPQFLATDNRPEVVRAVVGALVRHVQRSSALVLGVVTDDAAAVAREQLVERRALANFGNGTNGTDPFCGRYTCHCTTTDGTAGGTPYGPNGCVQPQCDNGKDPQTGKPCQCAYDACSCNEATVFSKFCSQCKPGYVLIDGVCYVANNNAVLTNIVLWIGLAVAISLIVTCYTVAGMDPGTDGVIYRMTSQRVKTQ